MTTNTITEVWKTVPDFEDYEVSNLGRVRSMRSAQAKIHNKPRILSNKRPSGDYPRVCLRNDTCTREINLHCLVAEVFIGPRPEGLIVLHEDDDRNDARAHKLRYGTYEDNAKDAFENGKQFRGSKHFASKLTEEQVIAIRADPRSQRVIAKDYGITKPSVANVKLGITYYDIPPSPTVYIKDRKVIPTLRKLNEQQVREIKLDPRAHHEIGADYGVSYQAVWDVKHGVSYKEFCPDVVPVLRPPAKRFTEDQIRAIRQDDRVMRLIAEDYNCTQSSISEIKRRKAYAHVTD